MSFPIQITFREIEPSKSIEQAVHRKAVDLEKYCDRILHCRVTVEAPSQHHRQGQRFRITVDVGVPGQEIIASRGPADYMIDESVYTAIRDAFRSVRRELQSYIGRRRQQSRSGPRIAEELMA